MRNILRSLGARQSIGIGLIAIVVLIIVVAKVLPQRSPDSAVHISNPVTAGTGTASGGGVAGALDPGNLPGATPSAPVLHSPVPPVTSPGTKKPQTVAVSFAKAWVDHTDVSAAQWLHAVTAYTTTDLAAQLAETDPENVPATRVTGAATVIGDSVTSCGVHVPTNTGTLLLTMVNTHGAWMVDTVDWQAS